MSVLSYIFGGLLILISVVLIFFVTIQNPKGRGLSGAIGGDMGGMDEGRFNSNDARLAKWTKYVGIIFAVLVVLVGLFSMLK